MQDTFDYWLYGVPLIVPQAPGDFSEWMNAVPVVDLGASVTSFSGNGIAKASAVISFTQIVNVAASAAGQATASAAITHLVALAASGSGVAGASVQLGSLVSTPVTASGVSLASAALTAKIALYAQGAGTGISIAAATLSTFSPPVVGASRIASPRQPSFRTQNYGAHPFAYRKVSSHEETVRHLGD